MILIIVLKKEIADPDEGNFIYNLVKERLADRPDVEVRGHVTNHLPREEPPS